MSDTVKIGTLTLKFLVDEAASANKLVLFEMTVPSQAKVPAPHYHRDVDEAIYGLSGTLTQTVDGIAHRVTAGQAVFVPRGIVHGFKNEHDGDARVVVTLTPGSIGKGYFEEVAAVVNAGGPPDMAKVKAIMERWGLVPQ
jgi:quercetin dioxygenase-like cupin family protein